MKQIPESIKQQAVALRQQGSSYAEISKQLNISVGWCKLNLKQNTKADKEKFNKLYVKSKTTEGVSKSEIYAELQLDTLPETEQGKKVTSAVKRIRANNKENIVRPDWMLPTAARFCTDSIVNLSMDMEERCHEEAYYLHTVLLNNTDPAQQHKVPSTRKIKSAIASLLMAAVSNQQHSNSRLTNWLESLYKTANALEVRNHSELKISTKQANTNFDDIEHLMY